MDVQLNELEYRILVLVAEGLQNKDIADLLDVSIHTVKGTLRLLYDKFGFDNRVELAMWMVKQEPMINITKLREQDREVEERLAKRSHRSVQAYRQRHREQGLCLTCSNTVEPGYSFCSKHLNSNREKTKTDYSWLKEHGICVHCQRNPAKGMKKIVSCEECLRIRRDAHKRKKSKQV